MCSWLHTRELCAPNVLHVGSQLVTNKHVIYVHVGRVHVSYVHVGIKLVSFMRIAYVSMDCEPWDLFLALCRAR